jgi:hypothetical protein
VGEHDHGEEGYAKKGFNACRSCAVKGEKWL